MISINIFILFSCDKIKIEYYVKKITQKIDFLLIISLLILYKHVVNKLKLTASLIKRLAIEIF